MRSGVAPTSTASTVAWSVESPHTTRCFPSAQISPGRVTGFFGVSGMSSGSVLPRAAASGKTSSNEKMSRSSRSASASGRRSVSQDVSSDVRLSITRKARAWRAGIVTTGAVFPTRARQPPCSASHRPRSWTAGATRPES